MGRERVVRIQRARVLAAMVEVVVERGAGNVTVTHIVERSGVSRRTFYELFEDREECFLAAFDDAIERIAAVVVPAYAQSGSWRVGMRMALVALLGFLDHDRGSGRLVIVESLGAGAKALERRQKVLAQIVSIVDQGRGEAKSGVGLGPLSAEGVVGAVLAVLHGRLIEECKGRLLELTGPLMGMIVLPYLGLAVARRELERPVPSVGYGPQRIVSANPLRDVGMRLTYRTVRVLVAVAGHAGSSNRMVADEAGVSDQGQISKLLARLQRLGLIENTGGGAVERGEPNAWTLTGKGARVHEVIAS